MQILKGTGIDRRERRLISNLYMAQTVKVRLNRGERRSVKIGRGVRQGCCLSPIMFNLYSESMNVGPCHHGMARPRVADGGTASNMEGSCE